MLPKHSPNNSLLGEADSTYILEILNLSLLKYAERALTKFRFNCILCSMGTAQIRFSPPEGAEQEQPCVAALDFYGNILSPQFFLEGMRDRINCINKASRPRFFKGNLGRLSRTTS